MDKAKVIKELENFRKQYVETAVKLIKIREDNDLTPEAKARRIDEIGNKYRDAINNSKAVSVEATKGLQRALRARRKSDIVNGLKSADEIQIITDAIKNNAFNADMLNDITEIFEHNPVALESIRGALKNSTDESTQMLALNLPTDNTEKNIESLNKLIRNIENVPPVENPVTEITAAMYQNGMAFDSMIDFVNSIEI